MRGEFFYSLSAFIAAFRPVLFKHYKDYLLFTVIISLLSMWIGSVVYKWYEDGIEGVKDGIHVSLEWENIKLSLLSEIRFLSKAFSLLFLPISVAVPLSELYIASAAFFDSYINGTQYDLKKILSIVILIISGTLIGWTDYKASPGTSLFKYLFGGLLMVGSVILGGYMLIKFQNFDKRFSAGTTLMTESMGSLILLLPLLAVIKWPPKHLVFILLAATTFLFNIDIILKFVGLKDITSYQAIVLGTITTIVGTALGPYLFNEHMTWVKLFALIILISTILYSSKLD